MKKQRNRRGNVGMVLPQSQIRDSQSGFVLCVIPRSLYAPLKDTHGSKGSPSWIVQAFKRSLLVRLPHALAVEVHDKILAVIPPQKARTASGQPVAA